MIICMWRIDDRDVCVCVVYDHMMIERLEWASVWYAHYTMGFLCDGSFLIYIGLFWRPPFTKEAYLHE